MSEIAVRDNQKDLIARVRADDFKQQVSLALPENISADRFIRVTVTALMQTPELADADLASLFQSVLKCAQDGLLPDGREAALVIFKGKVQYLPMVGGLRKKLAEFGWSLRARVVCENDEFGYEYGVEQTLTHRPPPPGVDRGKMVAAYAVASHRDGRKEFTVMDADAIAKVRAVAKTQNVWNQWPEQMWEKSVAKQLANDVPLGPNDREEFQKLIDADKFESGEATNLLYGPSGEEMRVIEASEVSPQPERTDGDEDQGVVDSTGVVDDALSSVDPEARMLADEAGEFVPTNGTYSATGPKGPQTLAQLIQHTDGKNYLGMLLRRLDEPQNYVDAVWTFCGVYAPEMVAAAGREKP